MTYAIGDLIMVDGIRAKVVKFRNKVKGEFLNTPDKYIVFVEQERDYRMGTIKATASQVTPIN